jgi:TolB-like protein
LDEPPTALFDLSPAAGDRRTGDAPTQVYPKGSDAAPYRRYLTYFIAAVVIAAAGAAIYFYRRTAPVSGADVKQINSIAVLPFVNESGNTDIDYLSDGITETLISSLSRIPDLSVKARATVFTYKGKEVVPDKVGKELGVEAILIGRFNQHGDDLRSSVELVNTVNQNIIWSEQYNRKLSDLPALQDEIARDVSRQLRSKLSKGDTGRLTASQTSDTEAYQLYLRGKFNWNKYTEEGYHKAIEYYQQAIERDPNYALAYTGLSDTYLLLTVEGFSEPSEVCPRSKLFAEKALSLDPGLAAAYVSKGVNDLLCSYDWAGARTSLERALELEPRISDALHFHSHYLQVTGHNAEAIDQLKLAMQIDPFSMILNTEHGWALYFGRRYDDAIAECIRTKQMDPSFFVVSFPLAQSYMRQGKFDKAIEELTSAGRISNGYMIQAELGVAYAGTGRTAEAKQILADLERKAGQSYVDPYFIAIVHMALGDKDKAFQWLDKAFDWHSGTLVFIKVEPELDPLRNDPRFAELVRNMGLSEE